MVHVRGHCSACAENARYVFAERNPALTTQAEIEARYACPTHGAASFVSHVVEE